MGMKSDKRRSPADRQERKSSAGWQEGLIVAHYGIAVEVRLAGGDRQIVRVKRNSGHVVGDAVQVADDTLRRMERKSELRRRDARGGVHLVAANLDVLGIVVAPPLPAGFIDRAVVASRTEGMIPFLVVNKCDLPETVELHEQLRSIYQNSLPLFPLSAATSSGLEPLQHFFADGHRGAFVGSTGVGKSSLLNALCPDIDLKVGQTSEYRRLGRHTTTTATLHALPGGGELVDTPGFRDFGLVDISVEDLAQHFPGFESHDTSACRFRNCRHRTEPGCAVVQLLEQGRISTERYSTYIDLLGEVEAAEEENRTRGWRD